MYGQLKVLTSKQFRCVHSENLQPTKIAYQLRHVCLSVETEETPQSNLTLARLPTVNWHIDTLQEDLPVRTASLGACYADNRYCTFDVQTALKWVSQLYTQTDVAGPAHNLIYRHTPSALRQSTLTFSDTVLCCPLASKLARPLQERTELCAGQQSATIYRLRSGHRRGTPCATSGAGNPGGPKEHLRVGQPFS
jgi:hypothetical protein